MQGAPRPADPGISQKPMQRPIRNAPKARGFALVATLALMILLAILAVGLVSLSAVALRSAGQGAAQAEARGQVLPLRWRKFPGSHHALTNATPFIG